MNDKEFVISDEFDELLPLATPDSDSRLERSLIATNGPSEKLVVWQERNMLIDGHRRYTICRRLGLPYQVRYLSFENEHEVRTWMREWQLARRNLDHRQQMMVRAALAKSLLDNGNAAADIKGQIETVYEVDERTARRDIALAKCMSNISPGVLKRMLDEDMTTVEYRIMADLSFAEQNQIVNQAKTRSELRCGIRRHWKVEADVDDTQKSTIKVSPAPKINAVQFHRKIAEIRATLGATLRQLGDLSREINTGSLDLKDCRRLLADVDEIIKTWAVAYQK